MEMGEAIRAVGAGERPASFEQFRAALDPQWVADALAATDTVSLRRRKLPAEHVVWLVIGNGSGDSPHLRSHPSVTPHSCEGSVACSFWLASPSA